MKTSLLEKKRHNFLKYYIFLLFCYMAVNIVSAAQSTFTQGSFKYTFTKIPMGGSSVSVAKYGTPTGDITIPAKVTYNDLTYPVTSIVDSAFIGCTGITSITIPTSVTSIGSSAFSGCTGITSITIPSSVTSIGTQTFYNCAVRINVDAANGNYSSINGVLYNKTQTQIIQYITFKVGYFFIPSTVTSIGDYAFSNCTGLTSISIPPLITSIGDYAFSNCTGLTTISIPTLVTSIGTGTFSGCTSLTSIYANSSTPADLTASSSVFSKVKTTTCILYVPHSSISLYQSAIQWKDFTSIVAIPTVPELTTTPINNVTTYSANSGGNITYSTTTVIQRGVCWGTTVNPTIDYNSITSDGTGTGAFTSSIMGLKQSTTYHVRAFATNSIGTGYGPDIAFTTIVTPAISTIATTKITTTTASSGGSITFDGGATVIERGVCWSTIANPTVSNNKVSVGTGIGTFTGSITGLIPGTAYHVRAYATNSAGTSYGSDLTFTTISLLAPTITTTSTTSITTTSVNSGGNITSDGGGAVTARGVCWSTTANPTIDNSITSDGTGIGSFTSSITGLTQGTTYHIRAYATNSVGTSYGSDLSFTTLSTPILTTTAATLITGIAAIFGGNISSDGGAAVTARGVCWSTTANPTINNSITSDGANTGTFTSYITGLTQGTTYHVRAYATNSVGTSYGSDLSFTTLTTPTLTTTAANSITGTTANSGGNITSDGGDAVTGRGVCWSTTANPTIGNNTGGTSNGMGIGSFTSSITKLLPNIIYHVRAYAINSVGISYGEDLSFTTLTTPTITTIDVSSITGTTANSGGTISSDGGSTVTARGVCWSPLANPTISNGNKTTDGTGTTNFTSSIAGLTQGKTYHIRAYATNSIGTSYGSDLSFTTLSTPTLTTTTTSSINATTATFGGSITSDGGAAVTARGVCWSTTANPTIDNSITSDGANTGAFTSYITGLTQGTTYHVRAYATNSIGTSYGSDLSFTTLTTPTITTAVVRSAATTAISGGTIYSDGGSQVNAKGVCWSNTSNPTISNNKTTDGIGTATFTSNITGLLPNTKYYARAYATNSVGTSYGSELIFTTISLLAPTITTTSTTSITTTSVNSGGNITSDGGATITARGICWSTTANPSIDNSITSDGTGIGSFVSSITGLTQGTTYHIRAYATNSVGTSYGSDLSFTTLSAPILTTTAATSITGTTANSGGNITSDGGSPVNAKGVCWSTTTKPTISNNKTTDGIGTAAFTSSIIGLLPNTTYHIRAYATNSIGTAYGSDLIFVTLNNTALRDNGIELFNIYPNPTYGTFTLNMESNTASNSTVSLLNILGQKVYESRLVSEKSTLDLSGYNFKGIYFLQLQNEKGFLLGERKIIFK